MTKKQVTYKDSGVNVEAGEELVNSIKDIVKETHNVSVLSNIGGFGALFQPNFSSMKEPVLVSSVDGVGTKLIVAFKAEQLRQRWPGSGESLRERYCSVWCHSPLFYGLLFYRITRTKGWVRCNQRICKSMQGKRCSLDWRRNSRNARYLQKGEFDLAGTIVGAVDKSKLITGDKISKGDLVIGFKSSGLHTNGYSLARKVLFSEFDINDTPDGFEKRSVKNCFKFTNLIWV